MNLLPYHSETLVSALSKKEVLYHVSKVTKEVNFLDRRTQIEKGVVFNGIVGHKGFRISKALDKGNTFLPLLLGEVEETARGSIIFLSYRLFPGAVFFLAFWSAVLLAFTGLYFGPLHNFLYGSICLGLVALNYLIAIFLFNRQVKVSRTVFYQLINFQMKD